MAVPNVNKANQYTVAAPGALDGKTERPYLERPAAVTVADPLLYLYDLDLATRKIGMIVTVEDARTAAEQAANVTPYTETFRLEKGLSNAHWAIFGGSKLPINPAATPGKFITERGTAEVVPANQVEYVPFDTSFYPVDVATSKTNAAAALDEVPFKLKNYIKTINGLSANASQNFDIYHEHAKGQPHDNTTLRHALNDSTVLPFTDANDTWIIPFEGIQVLYDLKTPPGETGTFTLQTRTHNGTSWSAWINHASVSALATYLAGVTNATRGEISIYTITYTRAQLFMVPKVV